MQENIYYNKFKNILLPIDYAALGALVVLIFFPLFFNVTVYFPEKKTIWFAFYHYLGPLIPAVIFPLLLWKLFHRNKTGTKKLLFRSSITFIAFAIVVFVHFNLKLWAQLINPLRFDEFYLYIDQSIPVIVDVFDWLGDTLRWNLNFLSNPYHEIFIMMFFMSYILHSIFNSQRVLEHLSGAISFVLLFGGLAYCVAPAIGPFVFAGSSSSTATYAQSRMMNFFAPFIMSGGDSYSPEFFVAGLAAMPSLHLAHALVFGYFAFRHIRYLGWAYVIPIIYIATDAISAKWHYFIDLIMGLFLAMFCVWFSKKLMQNKKFNLGFVAHK